MKAKIVYKGREPVKIPTMDGNYTFGWNKRNEVVATVSKEQVKEIKKIDNFDVEIIIEEQDEKKIKKTIRGGK